jgi:hypothetical protein
VAKWLNDILVADILGSKPPPGELIMTLDGRLSFPFHVFREQHFFQVFPAKRIYFPILANKAT